MRHNYCCPLVFLLLFVSSREKTEVVLLPVADICLPMVQLANRLFNVSIEAADGQAPIWHPDVRFFSLKLEGKQKAYFYLDPYSRPAEKRGGAWCAPALVLANNLSALLNDLYN